MSTADPADPRLTGFRPELLGGIDPAGDITPVGDRWAIHGNVPLEGEVILGEFDSYEDAHAALLALGPAAPRPAATPVHSTVGHRDGWLIVELERRVGRPPAEVWRALTSSDHRDHGVPCGLTAGMPADGEPPIVFAWCPGPDTVRWEVDHAGDGARLALTTWIDSDDLDLAADTGAGYHRCFEQLVMRLDPAPVVGTDFGALTSHYLDAFAAAQADTD